MKNAAILLVVCYLLFPTLVFSQLVINEFYADVAIGIEGDANGDGVRSARADEFIEIINASDSIISLEGYTIWVSETLRHEFAATTLSPNMAIIVFGGGQPVGVFGDSPVVVASSGSLGLGNSGTRVVLNNPQNEILEEFIYPNENNNSSWTRDPDITGGFKSHFQVTAAYGIPFSPGTQTNGFPFNSPSTTLVQFHRVSGQVTEGDSLLRLPIYLINPASTPTSLRVDIIGGSDPIEESFPNYDSHLIFAANEQGLKHLTIPLIDDSQVKDARIFHFSIEQVAGGNQAQVSLNKQFILTIEDNEYDFPLLLNEIHADPINDIAGDANGDGIRDAKEDEFLEFVNTSNQSLDISQFQIWDADALRHEIPMGTIVAPNQAFVVFGGGMLMGDFGNAIVQTASSGSLNLLNDGDQIIVKDTNQATVYAYTYGIEASNNQSITRYPDLEGALNFQHSTVGNGHLFSPGQNVSAIDFTTNVEEQQVAIPITIFPNPNKGSFHIESPLPFSHVELLTSSGESLIITKESFIQVNLVASIYFLKIYTKQGVVVKKVSIE